MDRTSTRAVGPVVARRFATAIDHDSRSRRDGTFFRASVADAPGTPTKGRTPMASNAKKKTTMAKLQRENKLRERRLVKQARKEARKLEASRVAAAPDDDAVAGEPEAQEE
jgi:hypothetical protein